MIIMLIIIIGIIASELNILVYNNIGETLYG